MWHTRKEQKKINPHHSVLNNQSCQRSSESGAPWLKKLILCCAKYIFVTSMLSPTSENKIEWIFLNVFTKTLFKGNPGEESHHYSGKSSPGKTNIVLAWPQKTDLKECRFLFRILGCFSLSNRQRWRACVMVYFTNALGKLLSFKGHPVQNHEESSHLCPEI